MKLKLSVHKSETGASLVEYLLSVSLVAVVAIPAASYLGESARTTFEHAASVGLGGGTEGTVSSGFESDDPQGGDEE